jgi:hypothetical protein
MAGKRETSGPNGQSILTRAATDLNFACGLFMVTFGMVSILAVFSHLVLPAVLKKVSYSLGGQFEISASAGGVTIKSAGKYGRKTTIINVPATRLVNSTGITLRRGDKLTITATGQVDTGDFYNWRNHYEKIEKVRLNGKNRPEADEWIERCNLCTSGDRCPDEEICNGILLLQKMVEAHIGLEKISKDDDDLLWDLALSQLAHRHKHAYTFGWRLPDGTREFPINEKMDEDDDNKRKKCAEYNEWRRTNWRLHPGAEYGCLIGYLLPQTRGTERPTIEDIIYESVRVEIGHGTTIVYDGQRIYTDGRRIYSVKPKKPSKKKKYSRVEMASEKGPPFDERSSYSDEEAFSEEAQRSGKNAREMRWNNGCQPVLYLAVNDDLVREKLMEEAFRKQLQIMNDNGGIDCSNPHITEALFQLSFFYNHFLPFEEVCGFPDQRKFALLGLWFLDNKGSFTVVIQQDRQ